MTRSRPASAQRRERNQGSSKTLRRWGIGASVALAALALGSSARAGGMYYSDRGVRPLGRGGAFVAGADDLGAITYNPAGLADAGKGLLLDLAWVNVSSEFTRRTIVSDAAGNRSVVTFPTVNGTTPFLPIPTLAGSYSVLDDRLTFALGVHAPYAAMTSYPTMVAGQPAASRYSLVSLDGSALVVAGAYVAFKPIEQLRIGAGFEALTGELSTKMVFSASPQDRLLAAPEAPQYDAAATLRTKTIFAPSGHFGVTVAPIKELRIGLAAHLPFHIDAPAELNVMLPVAPTFDNARQEGSRVRVKTDLPAVFRAGIEGRFANAFRVELAYVMEQWAAHRSIDMAPENLRFFGITGFPSPFDVPAVSIPRNFRPSHSFRLGGEYTVIRDRPVGLDLRGGLGFETSAIPRDYLTPLTADLDRFTLALGAGFRPHPQWRLDVLYAHVFGFEETVDPATAKVPAVNPVRGNPTVPSPINGGTYSNAGNIVGLGATVRF
jgi:long-chain fatty acid transport protein